MPVAVWLVFVAVEEAEEGPGKTSFIFTVPTTEAPRPPS